MQRRGKLMWLYNDLTPHKRVMGFVTFIYFTLRNKFLRGSETSSTWLIGEARGKCLQENGYHFFLHCRAQHPENNVYFVVDKSSRQHKDLADNPHVLTYGSARHINIYLQAKICFYTHTYSDFIFRELFLLHHKHKKLVFLHHGVLGFKKFDKRYVADRDMMDLFIVGSTLERDILIKQVGVEPDKVKVTGYPRYDSMTDSASPDNLQIAYLPTHRNWLKVPKNHFRDTDFYKNVDNLIKLSELNGFLSNNNITLKVYLHASIQQYSTQFETKNKRIRIINFGEETPLDLICNSHLLITDYSSVSWDFLYLNKPVLFYRFDLHRYLASRGSYLPLDIPTFGDILFEASEVGTAIVSAFQANFVLAAEYKAYRDNIMPMIDRNNCARIFELANNLPSLTLP
jgi:CDP-glycerol glycerophosphotransferase (TagB/SpsB family)